MSAKSSLRVLQFTLGVVLWLYSVELVISQLRSAHHGLAFFTLLGLGSVETLAALLFLFKPSIGGPVLLLTFVAAAVIHVLHGEAGHIGLLLIYAAAVAAVMAGNQSEVKFVTE